MPGTQEYAEYAINTASAPTGTYSAVLRALRDLFKSRDFEYVREHKTFVFRVPLGEQDAIARLPSEIGYHMKDIIIAPAHTVTFSDGTHPSVKAAAASAAPASAAPAAPAAPAPAAPAPAPAPAVKSSAEIAAYNKPQIAQVTAGAFPVYFEILNAGGTLQHVLATHTTSGTVTAVDIAGGAVLATAETREALQAILHDLYAV